MKQPPHSKLLDAAAKRHLAPLGLVRKGHSRAWLDDQRWYVVVVEFQPSGFSKGSYLNVGAHFLWRTGDALSFDFGDRLHRFIPYVSDAQFEAEANRLALEASQEVTRLRTLFLRVQAVADSIPADRDDWPAYHRAIALGLTGNVQEASAILARLSRPSEPNPPAWQIERAACCARLQSVLDSPAGFRAAVSSVIARHRLSLRLPEIEDLLPVHG